MTSYIQQNLPQLMGIFTLKIFIITIYIITCSSPLPAQSKADASIANPGKDITEQLGSDKKNSFDKDSAELSEEQCAKIKESNATIERIARLDGTMSVRNLTLKYFDKSLFNFSNNDFEYLKVLKPFCDNSEEDVANLIFDKLKDKVIEAKETRNNTVAWIKKTTADLKKLTSNPSSIKAIHNAWKEMENRSHEMLETDLRYFANFLDKLRQKFYKTSTNTNTKFVSPFAPRETINTNR